METALGADFSDVRVHEGPQAGRIGALAFTIGQDIYFAQGQYQPDSIPGRRLLGHELAHVVQQRQGRVRGGQGAGINVVQDALLEGEAERFGHRSAIQHAVRADRLHAIGSPGDARQGSVTRFPGSPLRLAASAAQLRRSSAVVQRASSTRSKFDQKQELIESSPGLLKLYGWSDDTPEADKKADLLKRDVFGATKRSRKPPKLAMGSLPQNVIFFHKGVQCVGFDPGGAYYAMEEIEYTGNDDLDFQVADFQSAKRGHKTRASVADSVWHHFHDYDPDTNTGTLYLVDVATHKKYPHKGGMFQYNNQ
jgi:hypothetical protein